MTPKSYATLLSKYIQDQHAWAAGEIPFPPPPIMVHGKQGIGKTSIGFQVTAALGCDFHVVEGATQDPVEVGGLLDIDRSGPLPKTVRAMSEVVSKINSAERPVVLCFDDFHQGARVIQAAFTSALDIRRTIGGSPLPKSCYIMGTMNLASEKTVFHDIPTNLHTRLMHLYVSADLDGWCDRALADGISPELVAAVREDPELLHEVDVNAPDKASSTGRTLYVADYVWKGRAGTEDHILQELLRGCLGSTCGVKLYSRLQLVNDMPKLEDVIKNPKKAQVPKLAGSKYAISRSLALRAEEGNVGAILTYLERVGQEHLVFATRLRIDLERQDPKAWEGRKLAMFKDFQAFLMKNNELVELVTSAAKDASVGVGG